jgi:hypothetical protein
MKCGLRSGMTAVKFGSPLLSQPRMWQRLKPRQNDHNRGSRGTEVIGLHCHMLIAWVGWSTRKDIGGVSLCRIIIA